MTLCNMAAQGGGIRPVTNGSVIATCRAARYGNPQRPAVVDIERPVMAFCRAGPLWQPQRPAVVDIERPRYGIL